MAITWELDVPLPGDLYAAFAAASRSDHSPTRIRRLPLDRDGSPRPVDLSFWENESA